MLKLDGNTLRLDGKIVGTLADEASPLDRAVVARLLDDTHSIELAMLYIVRQQFERLVSERETLLQTVKASAADRDAWRSKAEVLAMLLGVEP